MKRANLVVPIITIAAIIRRQGHIRVLHCTIFKSSSDAHHSAADGDPHQLGHRVLRGTYDNDSSIIL
uniref:Uncharacterized protein n=1 Tax=Hordeum vulgare subsp. vulgare TaxID=112509 RepID=A0A8I6X8M4_HORVV